jgi:hypothetical protein
MRRLKWFLLAAGAGAIAACGIDNDGTVIVNPPPDQKTSFASYVIQQVNNTRDDTEPVPVEGLDFEFPGDDDQTAFASVLPPG